MPPTAITERSSEDVGQWLGNTQLLDLNDPKLRIQALRITQLASSATQKAVFIHDFVKSLPFGCVAAFDHVPAAAVLRAGRGDCHTKGTLFVALLRAAGVPARLRFVLLSSKFLAGIIDVTQESITHAVGEVYLSGRWVQTDTYVTDEQFEMRAWGKLVELGLRVGLGIHVNADRSWSGQKDSHAQYSDKDPSSLPLEDLGVAHDPKYFYSDGSKQERQLGWTKRLKWLLVATVVNHRVGKIRLGNFDC